MEYTVTATACGNLGDPRSDSYLVSASEIYYAALNMNESAWHHVCCESDEGRRIFRKKPLYWLKKT